MDGNSPKTPSKAIDFRRFLRQSGPDEEASPGYRYVVLRVGRMGCRLARAALDEEHQNPASHGKNSLFPDEELDDSGIVDTDCIPEGLQELLASAPKYKVTPIVGDGESSSIHSGIDYSGEVLNDELPNEIKSNTSLLGDFIQVTDPLALGSGLTQARLKAGLTISEVARALDTSHAAISRLEKGKGNPTLQTILGYANLVGATITVGPTP